MRSASHPHRSGFTILELLIALAVIVVVATIAIPAWFGRVDVTLNNAIKLLAQDLRDAQDRAAYGRREVVVDFSDDGDGYVVQDLEGKPLPAPEITLIWPHPFRPWESVLLYSFYGVPTAYVSMVLIGLPFYFFARKLNLLSYSAAILAAVLACLPAAAFFGRSYHFWSMFGFLLLFGVPLSVVFAWIMKDKAAPQR